MGVGTDEAMVGVLEVSAIVGLQKAGLWQGSS